MGAVDWEGGIDVVVVELDNDRLFDILVQKMAASSNLARMAWLQKEKKKGLDCERNIGHILRTLRENQTIHRHVDYVH